MNVDKAKVLRIAIIALISLSTMVGVQFLYTRFSIEKTFIGKITEKSYVEDVEMTNESGTSVISIALKEAEDISEIWDEVHGIARQFLRGRAFKIELLDNPGDRLGGLYHSDLQFPIYEAIKTGGYTKMKDSLDAIAEKHAVEIKIFLDSERLYLHVKEAEHNLYKILPLS